MARHGKMSHSPFHVESERYRYAVEHGDDAETYTGPRDCTHYVRATRGCNLWNSGFRTCAAFKCKYYTHYLQIKATCASCKNATVYENGVLCGICKKFVQLGEGKYCCYFAMAPDGKATYASSKKPDGKTKANTIRFSTSEKKDLCDKCKSTPYYGKRWCLTGRMKAIERSEIIDLIRRMKGTQVNGVYGVDFVLKGCDGKQTYKTKEAKKMIASGNNITLITEYDFIKIVRSILSN